MAAPAASAGVWLPPQDLSAPGRNATNPAVAMADSGATTAIWEKDNTKNAGFHGEVATREPSQGFTAPAELVGGVTDPQLEMTGGGQAVAVWKRLVQPPGVYMIQVAARPPGGAFAAPVNAAELPSKVFPNGLQMALNDSGDVAIAWTRDDPGSGVDKSASFVEATVGHAGGGFSAAEHVSLPIAPPIEEEEEGEKTILHLNAVEPSVAIDPAGDVVVVWRYFDGTHSVIEAAARPAGGTFSSPEVISSSAADSSEPEVAMDGTGNAIAVWSEFDGADSVVKAALRPPAGGFEPADDLSESGESSFGPEIAMTPGGLATAVWTVADTGALSIETSSRPPGGDFSAAAEVTPAAEQSVSPVDTDLKMNDAGDAVVAWPGRSTNGQPVVRAAIRTGTGAFSAPAEVSASSPDFLHPDVAIDAGGNATVIWNRSDGANSIAQVAGYDAGPPQMRGLSVPAAGMVGVPVTFSAAPFDVWPLASTGFNFGDGTGAPGTTVSHAYSVPGTYTVTATAVDAAGTPVSASGRIAISPSYEFRIGKWKLNKKKGTATLTVHVSGPGQVSVSGSKVKRKTRHATTPGTVKLRIEAKGKARKKLKKKGKAKVRVTVSFRPDGGDHAAKRSVSIVLKKR
ncbi:MAG TPA: PKD domain-containing protein [Solirubrobacterales bacterium]|nr:PKD domain-containing protein [Solirubrobacterales bacterium]